MALEKPFKRTVRQLLDGSYSRNGHWQYLIHPDYATDPRHYIRSFLIIQSDLSKLFEYIEPCEQNLNTASLRIQELLIRICVEIEANFTAVLIENDYVPNGNMNLKNDYCRLEFSHKLSEYVIKFPIWRGNGSILTPYSNWNNRSVRNWHSLDWYQAYNKCKHDRSKYFESSTFGNLIKAYAGLAILLSAQFMDETYSHTMKALGNGGGYTYDHDPEFENCIGGQLQIKFPNSWTIDERYGFKWEELSKSSDPIAKFDYNSLKLA